MSYRPARPLWRLILGIALLAYGALMLAINLYGCAVLGGAVPVDGWSLLVAGAALFIGWRLYRVD